MSQRYTISCVLLTILHLNGSAQERYDSIIYSPDSARQTKVICYPRNRINLIYRKPEHFEFVTNIPKTFYWSARETFSEKSLPALFAIAASTVVLVNLDQSIHDQLHQASDHMGLQADRAYKTVVSFKLGSTPVNVYEAPRNLNTALYSVGEGSTSVLLAAGFYLFGKVEHDYRSLQTSSQLMQSLLTVGITTQLLKRISGRESPFVATSAGGKWRPFTNPAVYQKNVPMYDAFPSGHMATMMATLVVITDNYPEKRWIKPIGYSLMSVVGLAMINNGVHWASDYPLAIGIGYVVGKVTVKMNRWVKNIK